MTTRRRAGALLATRRPRLEALDEKDWLRSEIQTVGPMIASMEPLKTL